MRDIADKVAFVTGGASGIGLGIAVAMLEGGMKVAIGDTSREHIDQAMEHLQKWGGQVHSILVDITNRPALEGAAAEVNTVFGKVHALVNNAGIQNPAALSNMNYQEWDRLIEVNVSGIFNGIRAFLPYIKQHGEGGHVLTTASIIGLFTGGDCYGAYSASKFAAVGMMEALRAELAGWNIGVSILCPGPVRTNLEKVLADWTFAADPGDIGCLALRGMRNNDLYILTHPEYESLIRCRNDLIVASIPNDVLSTDERKAKATELLQSSIYNQAR